MKHPFFIALALLCCCLALPCLACGESGVLPPLETPAPTPTATPTPTPTPQPVVAVWADGEANAFFEGVAAAAEDGVRTTLVPGGAEAFSAFPFEGSCAALCCLTEPEPDYAPLLALSGRGVPVLCYATAGQTVPEGLFAVRYDAAGAAEAAMEALLAYPPHDTPVRVIGLFSSREGDAFSVFSEYADAGKLLTKGVYAQSDKGADAPEAALEGLLKKYYPGMLDAFYAETPALALAAADALSALGRDDAEVFCSSADEALLAGMLEKPALLAVAAGENPYYAGRLCREFAARLALGVPAEVEGGEIPLYPRVFSAKELPGEWGNLAAG